MVSLAHLNSAPDEEFIATLGGIYEHSDWVPRTILPQRPFRDSLALLIALREAVDHSSNQQKLTLIRSHPDLAGKLARAGNLTSFSTREQASLGLDRLSDQEYDEFTANNLSYGERFSFPFIICARLNRVETILDAMQTRLSNDRDQEITTALDEIYKIARLRLEDIIADE